MDRRYDLSPEERDRTVAILREHLLDLNDLETDSGPQGSDPAQLNTPCSERGSGDVPLMESTPTHNDVLGQSRIL